MAVCMNRMFRTYSHSNRHFMVFCPRISCTKYDVDDYFNGIQLYVILMLPTYFRQWERERGRSNLLVLLQCRGKFVILIWWAIQDTGYWEIQWVLKVKREWLWQDYRNKVISLSLSLFVRFSYNFYFYFLDCKDHAQHVQSFLFNFRNK